MSHILLWGIVPISLVLWLFLGDVRPALIAALAIPSALSTAIAVLMLGGDQATLMAVGTVNFGILSAATVVAVENVYRCRVFGTRAARFRRLTLSTDAAREYGLRIVAGATLQIMPALIFAALMCAAMLLVLLALAGVDGDLFSLLMKRFACAVGGGLIAAFAFVAALSVLVLRGDPAAADARVMTAVQAAYRPLLNASLQKPLRAIGICAVAFALMAIVACVLCSSLPLHFGAWNASGCVGFLGLSIVNAAIVVAAFERNVAGRLDRLPAICNACEQQLRPVLASSMAVLAGVLPAAIWPDSGDLQRALALCVASGAVVAPVVALIALPALMRVAATTPLARIIRV